MPTNNGGERLLSLLERVERLEEEKKALSADIADIKTEARSAGFDMKVFNQMLRERRMSEEERIEHQSMCEIYRAALGMLEGTPLGQHARERMMRKPEPHEPPPGFGEDEDPGPALPFDEETGEMPPSEPVGPKPPTAEELLTARAEGSAAAIAGKPVTANPYAADDPRRSSWDEAFCAACGSDGMDIPPAFRRSTPKKSEKGSGAGKGN